MRCYQARRYLDLRLDNEIRESCVSALDKHLAHCASCQTYQTQAAKLSRMLHSLPQPEFPDWLHHQIIDKARQHDHKRVVYKVSWRLRAIPALLALVLSLAVGTLIGSNLYKQVNAIPESATVVMSSDEVNQQVASFGESSLITDTYSTGEQQ